MPFTIDQFLDVFGRYNQAVWPVEIALWIFTAAALVLPTRPRPWHSRFVAGLLVFHWAWSGIVYHAGSFAAINPAARVFAALFVIEAVVLFGAGVLRDNLRFTAPAGQGFNVANPWRVLGYAFVVYGLLYPAISLSTGHTWPRAPMFAVPCPTTLVTAGFLLMAARPLPIVVVVAPVLWAVVGGSASILLLVPADYALFAAALVLILRLVADPVAKRRQAARHEGALS